MYTISNVHFLMYRVIISFIYIRTEAKHSFQFLNFLAFGGYTCSEVLKVPRLGYVITIT